MSCQFALDFEANRIADAALDMLQCRLHYTGPSDVADLLAEIADTFAVAAARLGVIQRADLPTK
jgi:hypothetical protein